MEGIKNFFRNLVMREIDDETMYDEETVFTADREEAEVYEFESLKKNREKNKRRREIPVVNGSEYASIVMLNVKEFNDAQEICDSLKAGKAIIANFEDVNELTARRIKDIAYGTCYAIEGELRLSTKNVLVIAPKNFSLEGNEDDYRFMEGRYPWMVAK